MGSKLTTQDWINDKAQDRDREDVFNLLDMWFTNPGERWGSKGYIVLRLAGEFGISEAAAGRYHAEWAHKQDNA